MQTCPGAGLQSRLDTAKASALSELLEVLAEQEGSHAGQGERSSGPVQTVAGTFAEHGQVVPQVLSPS